MVSTTEELMAVYSKIGIGDVSVNTPLIALEPEKDSFVYRTGGYYYRYNIRTRTEEMIGYYSQLPSSPFYVPAVAEAIAAGVVEQVIQSGATGEIEQIIMPTISPKAIAQVPKIDVAKGAGLAALALIGIIAIAVVLNR